MPATPFPRFLFRWIIIPMILLGSCSSLETPTPRSALNYFRDGNTAYQKRDYPTAIWNYRQAIVLDDETPSFYYNLGLAYFQAGDYERALDSFENVLEMEPDQPDAHYYTALVYYRMRNSDKANRHYKRYQILLQQQGKYFSPSMFLRNLILSPSMLTFLFIYNVSIEFTFMLFFQF